MKRKLSVFMATVAALMISHPGHTQATAASTQAGSMPTSNAAGIASVGVPAYTISQINTLDANFFPDSNGVNCSIDGVVFTDDFDGNTGYSFYVYDNTGAINIYRGSDEPNGYQVSRGDSIRVFGDVDFYNGLTEINVDSIQVLGTATIRAPRLVTALDESTESDLVQLNGYYLVSASQWPSSGNNANVSITNGTDTYTLRVNRDTDLDENPAPMGTFNVIGVGGQYDSSSPYDNGYQIHPRDITDIMVLPTIINGVPLYQVSQINGLDANGAADSLNVNCAIDGVVYTDDFDGNAGYSFFMYDNSGGINVFDFVDEPNGYQVSRGDSIRVFGDIDQFNGLLEIAVDSIQVLGTGISLNAPMNVPVANESTEGNLIRLNGYSLITPSQWPTAGNSASVDITNGVDTVIMRIDSDTDIDGTMAPTGPFDVIGASGQYDSSSPFDEGYQILPRDSTDIIPAVVAVPCSAPFFSEYIEGSSNNKGFEVYNPTAGNLDLGPYKVYMSSNGGSALAEFNLMGTLASGDVYTIVNSLADPTMLAIADTALSYPSVAHFNGDDALFLVDTVMGDTIDIIGVIGVDPGSNWPVGSGSTANNTLVRMATVSNGQTNWAIGATEWDVHPSNTFSFFGNHSSNCVVPAVPTVEFAMPTQSAIESIGTTYLTLNVAPTNSTADTVYLQFTPGAGLGFSDGTISPAPDPVTGLLDLVVPAGSDSVSITFNVIDDLITEGNETLYVDIIGVSAGLVAGVQTSTSFIIEDNDIPTYTIGQVRGVDADFIPDSLGVTCKLVGTVFTDDFDGNNGYSFYMYDATGAINVFNFDDVASGYQVQRGDSIRAIGTILFYNGLTEIQVDSIALIASGVTLRQPRQVYGLDEGTESDYIRLNGYYLVDPSTWPVFAGSSVNMEITNGQDTLVMRIDSDTDIDGTQPPMGYFDVIGAGGQFDSSIPHDEGYQIFPRDTNDIIPITLPELYISEVMPSSSLSAPVDGDWFEVRNMGTSSVNLNGFSWDDDSREAGKHTITSSVQIPANGTALFVEVADADVAAWETEWKQNGQGLLILNEGDEFDNGFSGFSSNGDEVNLYDDAGRLISAAAYTGADVTAGFSLEFDMMGALVGASVDGVNGAYTSINGDVGSPGDQSPIGLDEILSESLTLYPNPSNGVFTIASGNTQEKSIQIMDLNGALIYSKLSTDKELQVDLTNLAAGIYLVKVKTEDQEVIRKMVLR
ncbi:DUF5689 domain-containing protein [Croceimicrobium sp.]|uniref:DUF5689 domain-containing protein n=1 Tax=Croceimicrobium sp. TaxID=2828340 RepID=UPI003BAA500D